MQTKEWIKVGTITVGCYRSNKVAIRTVNKFICSVTKVRDKRTSVFVERRGENQATFSNKRSLKQAHTNVMMEKTWN